LALSLDQHLELIEDEYAAALETPLSARQARLVAGLVDKFVDRLFLDRRAALAAGGIEDVLAYRLRLKASSQTLAAIFDLCAIPASAQLVTEAMEVPIADYPKLSVEDYMVSLYNRNTVQRVFMVADGKRELVHPLLGEAIAELRRQMAAT
jgi:hypothetical protein